MEKKSPKIIKDTHKFSDLVEKAEGMVPHYTPEWNANDKKDPGVALLKIFSSMVEGIIGRLNQVPHKSFVAFLDMLGVKRLPAQPAKVPLQFKLPEGAEKEILLPTGTQAAAGDIPFETDNELYVTPSTLNSVITVDPVKDEIYKPPPKFLERELPDKSKVKYKVFSFSLARTANLQLDHVEGLEQGDFLKIGEDDTSEYVIIKRIEGEIITFTEDLSFDHSPDTIVEKVTKFHLFESNNWQEHILYIGHADMFNIKSPALFTIIITHLNGTESGIEPLEISWEYWGEIEGEKGEDWRTFILNSDERQGITQSGNVELVKPTEGEIKELEINNIKSRWIRCKLEETLPTNIARKLPVLDEIKFLVQSAGDPLPVDQAFYNDTPLDVSLHFFSFLTEPRIFDSFNLSSNEIFSKKGAKIDVIFSLDSKGILAAPTAILIKDKNNINNEKIKVFARGTKGRLVEQEINTTGGNLDPKDRGLPSDTTIALPDSKISTEANPGVVYDTDNNGFADRIWIFAKAENGHLVECLYSGTDLNELTWIDHGMPPNSIKVKFDPSAVRSDTGTIKVFVVCEDGKLYTLTRDRGKNKGIWKQQGTIPGNILLDSSPYAVSDHKYDEPPPHKIKVFTKGNDGILYEWDEVSWILHKPPNSLSVDSRPFAELYSLSGNSVYAKVFIKDNKGNLQEIDTYGASDVDNAYNDLEIEIIRGSGRGQKRVITSYNGNTKEAEVNLVWSSIPDDTSQYQITTENNGTAQGGTNSTITLASTASDNDGAYNGLDIEITAGTGASEVRRIVEYDGTSKVAEVNSKWTDIPDHTFQYEIGNLQGNVSAGTDRTLTLAAWTDLGSPNPGSDEKKKVSSPHGFIENPKYSVNSEKKHIFVRGVDNHLWERDDNGWIDHQSPGDSQLRHSPFLVRSKRTGSHYVFAGSNKNSIIEREFDTVKHSGTAQVGTDTSITLDDNASNVDDAYNGMEIIINGGTGSVQSKTIVEYIGSYKLAKIEPSDPWNPRLDNTSQYQIYTKHNGTISVTTGSNTIELSNSASNEDDAYNDLWIEITGVQPGALPIGESHPIIDYDGTLKVATLNGNWSEDGTITEYEIKSSGSGAFARVGTNTTITLDDNASSSEDVYNGNRIAIIDGDGIDSVKEIIDYLGAVRVAIVDQAWNVLPSTNSQFQLYGAILKSWKEFEDPVEADITPELSWEYWNSHGWVVFEEKEHAFEDGTRDLFIDGNVKFRLPDDIKQTEVSGQEGYWIRARIVGGDYGRETFTLLTKPILDDNNVKIGEETELIPSKSSIRQPLITELTIKYELVKEEFPEKCITFNNLVYKDQTAACITANKRFSPFLRLENNEKTIYLGFEKALSGGPIKIFFAAKELPFTDLEKPKVEWQYRGENNWKRLNFADETEGLIRQGILELIGPRDFTPVNRFGDYRFWIKGTLIEGIYEESPHLDGIYPNTTMAFQAETIKDEILGSSDGTDQKENLTYQFNKFPVREGEEVRIREELTIEEKEELLSNKEEILEKYSKEAVREITDEAGKVENWVLWTEVFDFFDSKPDSRHYTLDRATGEIEFGDGNSGITPPKGDDNIRAFSYQAGGGVKGNIIEGKIDTFKSAIEGVDSVLNPVEADGGADTATIEQMLEIGPAKISHRNRAVTLEDFEWLAKEASRKVLKARCLPNTNKKKNRETGWVTVIIVPDSKENKPYPTLALKRIVRKYLEKHSSNTLSSQGHIYVEGPLYREISVSVYLYVTSIDVASKVEREAIEKLNGFFHPLTGGPEGKGWEFGRDASVSDIYVLLEDIEGLDHVENLSLSSEDKTKQPHKFKCYTKENAGRLDHLEYSAEETPSDDVIDIKDNFLVANGTHTINIQLANSVTL